ncbi:sensor histidine kinase [Lactococcus protaetiae]|uniref:histidine kinase n=1 Tax=Lactococcus protaetiae TaxID=2592653 RepID=A0A514ZAV4_9LACT|nr:sensor histidine kinase [Lactococcus protaetiae]QDK71709.1 HAMP domain-containing histidine kinase [Lactococcus protaetiae]
MLWFKFLKSKLPQIGVFLLILAIYVVDFLLWHLPMMALLNSTLFALVIFIIYLVSSYFRWKSIREKVLVLTKENKNLQKRLEQQNLAERDFEDVIRVWSHQMKVPLSAIDLMTQTKINERELKNQLFSLENYLKILLEYQRINNLATDFRFNQISLSALTKDLVKKYSSFFIQKNLSVKIEGEWSVVSDQRWLSLAIEQLLNNAVKYTKEGGILVQIEPGKFSIKDTGIGILSEDIPRLFEHGFTGFNGRIQQKSTGLGLYLAKLILDKLEFKIEITSEIGKGTCVTLTKE